MPFVTSPSNGQTETVDGRQFKYDIVKNVWVFTGKVPQPQAIIVDDKTPTGAVDTTIWANPNARYVRIYDHTSNQWHLLSKNVHVLANVYQLSDGSGLFIDGLQHYSVVWLDLTIKNPHTSRNMSLRYQFNEASGPAKNNQQARIERTETGGAYSTLAETATGQVYVNGIVKRQSADARATLVRPNKAFSVSHFRNQIMDDHGLNWSNDGAISVQNSTPLQSMSVTYDGIAGTLIGSAYGVAA